MKNSYQEQKQHLSDYEQILGNPTINRSVVYSYNVGDGVTSMQSATWEIPLGTDPGKSHYEQIGSV